MEKEKVDVENPEKGNEKLPGQDKGQDPWIGYGYRVMVVGYLQMVMFSSWIVILLGFASFLVFSTTLKISASNQLNVTLESATLSMCRNSDPVCLDKLNLKFNLDPAFLSIAWFVLAALAIMNSVQLWAAVVLLNANEIDVRPARRLQQVQFWRNVNVIFLAIDLTVLGSGFPFYTFGITTSLLRIAFLCMVSGYKKKLEEDFLESAQTPADTVILI